jgi:hypothetical protein
MGLIALIAIPLEKAFQLTAVAVVVEGWVCQVESRIGGNTGIRPGWKRRGCPKDATQEKRALVPVAEIPFLLLLQIGHAIKTVGRESTTVIWCISRLAKRMP